MQSPPRSLGQGARGTRPEWSRWGPERAGERASWMRPPTHRDTSGSRHTGPAPQTVAKLGELASPHFCVLTSKRGENCTHHRGLRQG